MELGLYTFADMPASAGISPEQRVRNLLEEAELAEQVGLDVFGVGEHHRPDFVVSAPAVVLGGHRGAHGAHPPDQRGHRAQLGRPGARLPGLRHARPALRRSRGDHGRARLVHRVVPAVRLRPRRLRRAVRREARAAARAARLRAGHLVRPAPRGARGRGRVPAARAGPAARLGRGRRHPAVGRARRQARPAAGAGDHRRGAGALRAARRALPRRRRAGRARRRQLRVGINSHTYVADTPEQAARRVLPGLRGDDEPHRPRARLVGDDARAVRLPALAARRAAWSAARRRWSRRSSSSTSSSATTAFSRRSASATCRTRRCCARSSCSAPRWRPRFARSLPAAGAGSQRPARPPASEPVSAGLQWVAWGSNPDLTD